MGFNKNKNKKGLWGKPKQEPETKETTNSMPVVHAHGDIPTVHVPEENEEMFEQIESNIAKGADAEQENAASEHAGEVGTGNAETPDDGKGQDTGAPETAAETQEPAESEEAEENSITAPEFDDIPDGNNGTEPNDTEPDGQGIQAEPDDIEPKKRKRKRKRKKKPQEEGAAMRDAAGQLPEDTLGLGAQTEKAEGTRCYEDAAGSPQGYPDAAAPATGSFEQLSGEGPAGTAEPGNLTYPYGEGTGYLGDDMEGVAVDATAPWGAGADSSLYDGYPKGAAHMAGTNGDTRDTADGDDFPDPAGPGTVSAPVPGMVEASAPVLGAVEARYGFGPEDSGAIMQEAPVYRAVDGPVPAVDAVDAGSPGGTVEASGMDGGDDIEGDYWDEEDAAENGTYILGKQVDEFMKEAQDTISPDDKSRLSDLLIQMQQIVVNMNEQLILTQKELIQSQDSLISLRDTANKINDSYATMRAQFDALTKQ